MATKFSNQPFLAVAAGVAAITFSGFASAQTSGSPGYYPDSHSSAVEPTSPVATQLISATSLSQMLNISNALTMRASTFRAPPGVRADAGQRVGMAAGNGAGKWNVWGSLSGDNFEYGGNSGGAPVRFDADTTNAVFGADYALNPALSVGASIAFDNATGTGGFTGAITGFKNEGYTVAPYVGYQINNDWSLDATIGLGEGKLNQTGAETKPERFFYGANFNYTHWYGNIQATGKVGYLYGEEKYDAPISSTNKIDQWRLGGQIGYWMNGVLPYFGLAYTTDSRKTANTGVPQPGDDLGKDAWVWSLGANFISVKNNLTGGIVYSSESGRSNGKRDILMANINYRF